MGCNQERTDGLASKARHLKREEEFQRGDQLGQRWGKKWAWGRGSHFIDRRECPGKDCSRILNSESYKDPASIILLDTRCGKVIWNIKLLNSALTECLLHSGKCGLWTGFPPPLDSPWFEGVGLESVGKIFCSCFRLISCAHFYIDFSFSLEAYGEKKTSLFLLSCLSIAKIKRGNA